MLCLVLLCSILFSRCWSLHSGPKTGHVNTLTTALIPENGPRNRSQKLVPENGLRRWSQKMVPANGMTSASGPRRWSQKMVPENGTRKWYQKMVLENGPNYNYCWQAGTSCVVQKLVIKKDLATAFILLNEYIQVIFSHDVELKFPINSPMTVQ